MVVREVLTLDTDELTQKDWRKLFSRLSYSDGEGILYEPWQVLPHKHKARIPRGAWSLLPDYVEYADKRLLPPGRSLEFTGQLDAPGFEGQFDAVKTMIEQEQGLIIAQPGFGKTNVALAFAAVCKTPTLVLVHTEDILDQWVNRASELLPDAVVGVIRGRTSIVGDITISTVQTFSKRILQANDGLKESFGCVILDEAHHAPASTFDQILNAMPAHYRFGFTATDKRADGRHPYMKVVIGPVIYRHKFKSKVPVEVVPVKTHGFYYGYRGSWDWRNLLNALKNDDERNCTIAKIVVDEIKAGNSILVLSREIDHLQNIYDFIDLEFGFDLGWTQQVEILAAALLNKDERKKMLADFREGKLKCILATQLADEALDVPRLNRIVLTFPGKHDGRIIQQVGRALREHPDKVDALVYDVVDDRVGVLRRQWMKRKQAYKAMGIKVRKVKS